MRTSPISTKPQKGTFGISFGGKGRKMGSRLSAATKEPVVGVTSAPPRPVLNEPVTRPSETRHPRVLETQKDEGPAWTVHEFQKLFRNYEMEENYDVTNVEGTLPTDIEGTFLRNGPGLLEYEGAKMHVFDGHGFIGKVSFLNGKAHFRSKYIRTEPYMKESGARKVLYRGFGTTKPGGMWTNFMDFEDKPVANTSVIEWAGKLYALWEGHNPYELDPTTLETLGRETFDGVMRIGQPFTAHPTYDPASDRLVAFSNAMRAGEGRLQIWELDRDNHIKQSITHKVGSLPILYLHDFQITKNWYIFHQAPLSLVPSNMLQYFLGLKDSTKQIGFDKSTPGKFWLVPRDGGEPQLVETNPLMLWHYGNAFEDEMTGKVTVDACAMKDFPFSSFDMRDPGTIPGGDVTRFEIDPQSKTCTQKTVMPGLASGDFPQFNPAYQNKAYYRYLYIAASADGRQMYPFRRVAKVDMLTATRDSWLAPPGCFVGEPIYVPRKRKEGAGPLAEDDGYILCLISDARKERSRIAIFEASRLSEGPVCFLNLKHLLPMAFHCGWSDTAYS